MSVQVSRSVFGSMFSTLRVFVATVAPSPGLPEAPLTTLPDRSTMSTKTLWFVALARLTVIGMASAAGSLAAAVGLTEGIGLGVAGSTGAGTGGSGGGGVAVGDA